MPKLGKTPLHLWMKAANDGERQRLAELVGISLHYVKALAYGHRSGGWDVLMRIAWAARKVRGQGGEEAAKRLPDVQRGDVSPICANCPFYQACKKTGIKEVEKQ